MYDGSEVTCYDKLRLTKRNFHDLCAILRERCGLSDSVYITVEEKDAMFLLVVGNGLKMRLLHADYERSLEIISRHFSDVLTAILSLSAEFIKLLDPSIQPSDDYKWKWFGNALGALDGCHVEVCVPLADQGRYRNRKQQITTSMLGVVDWNMKFLYVLPGWEGSASDSRVLCDAGHYYLVDAGYTNGPGFLAPFRSTRYHLKEWVSSQQQPKTPKELYNLRHSHARNVVERTFGLLKKKWAILRTESFFGIKDQNMASSKGTKRLYVTWTDEMDAAFLAVLVEHHNNGDHAQNGWKPHVYTAAIRNVREKCGVEITKDNITSRCKTFDKHYDIIGKILSQSGFGWDWENDKLLIDSDDVWNRYAEANKSAACYKTKVVKNWDAISTIYSKDHANGKGARTDAESAQVAAEEVGTPSPELPQKRQQTGDATLSMLGDMKTSFNDAFKSTEALPLPQVAPPAEILGTLQMIPDLSKSDMLRCYGKLILSERLFQVLLELPMDFRKEWLLLL